ncbi:MAG: ABC transporter ATP-binding protein [Microbacterium sp.]|uniref:ABC transporter ATP-binding protein n=1 Tax=Microbacterium sp. TaxID=51671 RepID=UPI001AD082FE|nr:ABC transporter ATP-binding protein [Microbacterium sp.]MBN9155055.1 ABC transporter ATP-binding protein [Microbacterium sp.]MBN9171999.1 ABC transporter ATP-binding protein [Microbacterium sp.]
MSAVVHAHDLVRTYGSGETEVHAVAGVSLELHPAELVVLRGPSGSGKTTLLNLLGGLDRPTSGTVRVGDVELTTAAEGALSTLRQRDVGFVFQSFALLPVLSAAENVEVPLRILRTPARERGERVAELLDLVGLSAHRNQRPYELSGGQQQRVGIARALAANPRVLIADEPTGQLDSATAEQMMTLIADIVRARGVAAIVSTHDPKIAEHADRVLRMRAGRLE